MKYMEELIFLSQMVQFSKRMGEELLIDKNATK